MSMLGVRGPDPADGRDYSARVLLAARLVAAAAMPAWQDYRVKNLCPTIRNQDGLGACVAFSWTAMREFILRKQIIALQGAPEGLKVNHLSPLAMYYRARAAMGPEYIPQDSGTYVRLAMDMGRTVGCPTEAEWPYVVANFAAEPPAGSADRFKSYTYWRIPLGNDSMDLIRQALAQEYGVVLAVMVFDNVMGPFGPVPLVNGRWPMPDPNGSQLVGWHALFICGYADDATAPGGGWVLVHNSWGPEWGAGGHGWMPYDYILRGYWSDAWVGVA